MVLGLHIYDRFAFVHKHAAPLKNNKLKCSVTLSSYTLQQHVNTKNLKRISRHFKGILCLYNIRNNPPSDAGLHLKGGGE